MFLEKFVVKNERIGTCKNGILVNDGLIGFVQGILKWLKMYKTFPEIVDTACRQSNVLLSWSHYRTLLQVKDPEARAWYEKEAAEQIWSVRTLQRNVSSQYYYRMLKTQKKEFVEREMKKLTAPYQNDKLEFIKNPVVAEFLGFSQNSENQSPDFILQVDCIYFSICLYCKQK
ncbi:hypothetical protein JCM37173_07310 [Allocoprococcus similis]